MNFVTELGHNRLDLPRRVPGSGLAREPVGDGSTERHCIILFLFLVIAVVLVPLSPLLFAFPNAEGPILHNWSVVGRNVTIRPRLDAVYLHQDQVSLELCVLGSFSVPLSLIVFAAIMNPDLLRDRPSA